MDNAHLTKYTPSMQGKYYIIDTTIDPTMTAVVPAMNGRQGDTMRQVPLAIVDDNQPHDCTGSDVELRAQDAAGVVKVSDIVVNWVSRSGGLLVFGIPSAFYQHPGEYQHAYFVITDKDGNGNATSTSTVSVDFYVAENGIEITAADSHIFISSVDRMLETAKSRVEAVKLMGENAEATLKGYQDTIKAGDFPTKAADNQWTGTNSFKALSADSLSAPILDSMANSLTTAQTTANSGSLAAGKAQADVDQVQSSVSNLATSTGSAIESLASASSSAVESLASASTATSSSTTAAIALLSSAVSSVDADMTDIHNSLDSQASQLSQVVANQADNSDYGESMISMSKAISQVSTTAGTAWTAASSASFDASMAYANTRTLNQNLSSATGSLSFALMQLQNQGISDTLSSISSEVDSLTNAINQAKSLGKL